MNSLIFTLFTFLISPSWAETCEVPEATLQAGTYSGASYCDMTINQRRGSEDLLVTYRDRYSNVKCGLDGRVEVARKVKNETYLLNEKNGLYNRRLVVDFQNAFTIVFLEGPEKGLKFQYWLRN